MKAAIFLITGFEETEALTPFDVLRRGQVDVKLVSLTDQICVTGSQGLVVKADISFSEALQDDFGMLILPGGAVGTANYQMHETFLDFICKQNQTGKLIAAICAAPTILGKLGILKNKRAVCYPGMENELTEAVIGNKLVEIDGNIITSKGPATALFFGLHLLSIAAGKDIAEQVRKGMLTHLIAS